MDTPDFEVIFCEKIVVRMKNVKFHGKKTNSAVNFAAQIPREKPKFRGSARNSAARGKLWALVISVKSTGSRWINGDRLENQDFANNIALLENFWKGMKELTDRTQKEAAKFGLNINPEKTKIMKVGRWDETEDEKIMIDGRDG